MTEEDTQYGTLTSMYMHTWALASSHIYIYIQTYIEIHKFLIKLFSILKNCKIVQNQHHIVKSNVF